MSYGGDNPSYEELMEVVQRQQEVIELFEQQVEACRLESLKLAEEGQKKSEIIEILEESQLILKQEIEKLKNEKEKEHEESGEKNTDQELETVGELRIKCKELNYELDRAKTRQSTLEVELETEKRNNEFVRLELEQEKRKRAEENHRLNANLEKIERELIEKSTDFHENQSKQSIEIGKLRTELEIRKAKEQQMDRYYEELTDEINETRREKTSAAAKNSAILTENAELKTRILNLKTRLPRNEHEVENMSKLIGDQSHLIATLREEVKLIARKLETDSRDYRQVIKALKFEKRELEQRIENFLQIE